MKTPTLKTPTPETGSTHPVKPPTVVGVVSLLRGNGRREVVAVRANARRSVEASCARFSTAGVEGEVACSRGSGIRAGISIGRGKSIDVGTQGVCVREGEREECLEEGGGGRGDRGKGAEEGAQETGRDSEKTWGRHMYIRR